MLDSLFRTGFNHRPDKLSQAREVEKLIMKSELKLAGAIDDVLKSA